MPSTRNGEVTLSYDVTGDGPPIVLVGGFSADQAFWAGVVPLLAPGRTVITMDNRGAGASSSPPPGYGVDDMTDDLDAVLAAVGVDGRVDVVGHSMGGAVALTMAARSPARVGHVVLAQSFARISGTALLALRAAGRAYDHDAAPIRELADSLFPWLFSDGFLQQSYEDLLRLSEQNPHPQPRTGFDGQLQALQAFDATPWLERIEVPTLVVGASADRLVTAAETHALEGIPDAQTVVVHGAGHCLPVERPALTAALVTGFCST